jgi:hypothetical protein
MVRTMPGRDRTGMTLDPHPFEAGLVLVVFFFVALPALVTALVSVALIVASGEHGARRPLRVGARQRGPAR